MKKNLLLFVFLLSIVLKLNAQGKTVSGTIYDTDKYPMPGVSIVVKGTTNGTITDVNGKFQLQIDEENTILQVSFIGFKTVELDASTQSKFEVILETDMVGLEEVVAVGYGVQKKVNVTGSVSTVKGDVVAKQPVSQASEALQGMSPGVTVSKTSGAPGSTATIRIRGITSYGGSDEGFKNDPLVLIDGMEGNLNAVDPNDIEDISVLKDAASAAIYGSRGANGVILVTTKRAGKDKFQINYKGWVGVDKFSTLPDYVNGDDYNRYLRIAQENDAPGNTSNMSEEQIQEYRDNYRTNPDEYPNVDWIDEVTEESAIKQNHYLGITGGTDKLLTRATFSYLKQDGLIRNNTFESYTLRINNDLKVTNWLKFSLDVNGRVSDKKTPSAGLGNIFQQANRIPATFAAQYSDGRYGPGWALQQNPLAYVDASGKKSDKWYRMGARIKADVNPIKDLTVSFIYAPKFTFNNKNAFNRTYMLYDGVDDQVGVVRTSNREKNVAYAQNDHSTDWQNTYNVLVNYKKNIGDHSFIVLLGTEAVEYHKETLMGYREGYLFQDYTVLNAGAPSTQQNSGGAEEWALASQFGRLNYDFQGKYLFEANFRRDGSSRFTEERWSIFPSFSLGWRVSEESFAKQFDWLDNLKVRASWGRLGNQNVGNNYPFMTTVTTVKDNDDEDPLTYALGTNPVPNSAGGVPQYANPFLTWEYTETTNVGFDLSVMRGLVSLSAEFYSRKTSDIIYKANVRPITGMDGPIVNLLSMENNGYDISIGSQKKFGDFGYSFTFNFDDVKNKVTDLDGEEDIRDNTISKEGHPIWSYYLYDTDGLLQEGETQDITYAGNNPRPGDIKYIDQPSVDTNGDGVADATDGVLNASDDKVIAGSNIPRYNYSFDVNLSYKNLDLSMFFQGVGKRDVLMTGEPVWIINNSSGNIQEWQTDFWTPENPNATYPNYGVSNRYNFIPSTYWLQNGAYLRLKNLQLSYNVPKKFLLRANIQSLRFFVSGQNLITWDDMPEGWDPESRARNNYPIVKTISGGLDITF